MICNDNFTAAIIKNMHLNYGKLKEKLLNCRYDAIGTAILPFATIPHITKKDANVNQILSLNVSIKFYSSM